jgi:hypothetical protein
MRKMDIDTSDLAIPSITAMIGMIPTSADIGGRVKIMGQSLQLR